MVYLGDEVKWLLVTNRYYNSLVLEQVKKLEKNDNPLGLASSMSMGDNGKVYNISLLTKENLRDLEKPLPKHLENSLRLRELFNSQIMNLYSRGFTKEQILDSIE